MCRASSNSSCRDVGRSSTRPGVDSAQDDLEHAMGLYARGEQILEHRFAGRDRKGEIGQHYRQVVGARHEVHDGVEVIGDLRPPSSLATSPGGPSCNPAAIVASVSSGIRSTRYRPTPAARRRPRRSACGDWPRRSRGRSPAGRRRSRARRPWSSLRRRPVGAPRRFGIGSGYRRSYSRRPRSSACVDPLRRLVAAATMSAPCLRASSRVSWR